MICYGSTKKGTFIKKTYNHRDKAYRMLLRFETLSTDSAIGWASDDSSSHRLSKRIKEEIVD